MKKIILLAFLFLFSFSVIAQNNWHIAYYSPDSISSKIDLGLWRSEFKLAYKIPNENLLEVLEKTDFPNFIENNTPFDTLHYTGNAEDILPIGNYIIVEANGKWIYFDYFNVSSFKAILFDHGVKTYNITILDSQNIIRSDAIIRNEKNKRMEYNKSLKGYIIPKSKKHKKYIVELGNEIVVYDFRGIKDKYKYYSEKRAGNGFLALDKPKYKIGDTLRFKAFIYNKKGKPYKKTLWLKVKQDYSYHFITSQVIKPQRPGVFIGEIILSDSLVLDEEYRIIISKKNNQWKHNVSNDFRLEDYQLDKYTLNVETNRQQLYDNRNIKLFIVAKDFKRKFIRGGRYEVEVSAFDISFQDDSSHFVPEILFSKKGALLASQTTAIIIDTKNFPNADASYTVKINTWNSANEMHSKELTFSKFISPKLELSIKADTVKYIFHNNQNWNLSLNNNGETTALSKDSGEIKIDFASAIPHFIIYNQHDTSKIHIPFHDEFYLTSYREGDLVFINTTNPRNLHFKYEILKNKKVLLNGASNQLDTIFYAQMKDEIIININYWAEGIEKEIQRRLISDLNNYSVNIELPDTISPGKELLLKVRVSDYNGNPIKNANITAWANNAEFNKSNNTPNFANSVEYGRSYNYSDSQFDKYNMLSRKPMNRSYQDFLMIPESQITYKMLFPDSGLYIKDFEAAKGFCHFAPYVVDNGQFKKIYYVLIDRIPVYLANYDERNWSFNYVKGNHRISFRTIDKLYTIHNVELKEGYKTEIVLDINNVPDSIRVTKKSKKLDIGERQMFAAFSKIIPIGYNQKYIQQGNTIYQLPFGYNNNVTSPLYNGEFVLIDSKKSNNYVFTKPYNKLQFNENSVNASESELYIYKKFNEYHNDYFYYRGVGRFSKRIIVDNKLEIEKPIIYPLFKYLKDDCKLLLRTEIDSVYVYSSYLRNLDSGNVLLYDNLFDKMDVKSGNYEIIAFTKTNNILVYKVEIKPNGTNYIVLNNSYKSYIPFNKHTRAEKDSIINELLYGGKLSFETYDNYKCAYISDIAVDSIMKLNLYFIDKKSGNQISEYAHIKIYKNDSLFLEMQDKEIYKEAIGNKNTDFIMDIYIDAYKSTRIYLNPTKLRSKILLIDMEKESNELLIYRNRIKRTSFKRGNYRGNTVTQKHGTVLYLGGYDEEEVSCFAKELPASRNEMKLSYNNTYIRGRGDYMGDADQYNDANLEVFEQGIYCLSMPVTVGGVFSNEDGSIGGIDLITGNTPAMFGDSVYSTATPFLQISPDNYLRKDFSDVGFWVPNLVTDNDGYAEVKIKFPDNITKWEVVAIAVGNKKKAGIARTSVIATKNQISRIETPRFLTQGDSCYINTKTINYTKKPLLIEEYFKLNDALISQKKLLLDSFNISQQLIIAQGNPQKAEFGFTSKEGESDTEIRLIEVVRQGSELAKGEFYMLDSDTSITIVAKENDIKLVVYKDLLEVLLNDIEEVKYYKYDCNEQKASKLMVLLLEEQMNNYLGIKFKEKKRIRKLIKNLRGSIEFNNYWGWWPNSKPMPWVTDHVLLALLMADNYGYAVNDYSFQYVFQTIDYENAKMRYLRIINSEITNPTTINWDIKDMDTEDVLWTLKSKKALNMEVTIEDVLELSNTTVKGGLYWGRSDYSIKDNKILCSALAFELINEIDSTNPALDKIILYLLSRHGVNKINTYETAYMVNAIVPYLLKKDSKLPVSKIFDAAGNALQFDKTITIKAGDTFTLKKSGSSNIFAMSYCNHFDTNPLAVDSLFDVYTKYIVKDSVVNNLNAGDKVVLSIDIIAKKHADYVMIEIPLPASCTYSNSGIYNNAYEVHREKYKEKLIIYCESLPQGLSTFKVELEARFSGLYIINPVTVKEMYYPFFYGRNGMDAIRVE